MTSDARTFDERMGRIETLIHEIEKSSDPSAREAAREMVAALLELHGAGLAKIVGLFARQGGGGQKLIDACLEDDLLRSLLLLHDLHPENVETRVRQALESVRPYLHSHGGNVELVEVSMDTIRLRMEGSCHGCPSSAATLKNTIEEAIAKVAPDVAHIEVEGLNDGAAVPGLVQIDLAPGVDAVAKRNNGSQASHCCHSTDSLQES